MLFLLLSTHILFHFVFNSERLHCERVSFLPYPNIQDFSSKLELLSEEKRELNHLRKFIGIRKSRLSIYEFQVESHL